MYVIGPHETHACEPHASGYYCRDCDVVLPLPSGHDGASFDVQPTADGDGETGINVSVRVGLP